MTRFTADVGNPCVTFTFFFFCEKCCNFSSRFFFCIHCTLTRFVVFSCFSFALFLLRLQVARCDCSILYLFCCFFRFTSKVAFKNCSPCFVIQCSILFEKKTTRKMVNSFSLSSCRSSVHRQKIQKKKTKNWKYSTNQKSN